MAVSRGRWAVFILIGLLLCLLVPAVTAGSGAASADRGAAEAGLGDLSTEEFEADRTRFRITVFENGSAQWVFRYEQRLDDDDATAEFEAFADRFTDEETESYDNFRARATALAESGGDATGREMAAVAFARDARIEERPPAGNEFGIVEMSFVWTDFADPDGDRLVVGDVFVDGLYVGPDQELRFDRGPSLRFDAVDPGPDSIAAETLADSETVTWVGETQFTDRRPRVTYVPRGTDVEQTPPVDSPTVTDPNAGSDATLPAGSLVSLLAVAIILLLGAGATIAYRTGRLPSGWSPSDDTGSTTMGSVTTDSAEAVSADSTTGSVPPTGSDAPADGSETGATAAEVETPPAVPDRELRSDEERVVDLLEENGGRMKQADIVTSTDWSKSKVSMLLSEMDEDGRISKLRIGRENIVSLAGHEPDAAGSPFDGKD